MRAVISRVLSPDVFLRPLADKFARLALQLLARYTSWLKLGSMASEEQGASPQPQPEVLPFTPFPPSFVYSCLVSWLEVYKVITKT